MSVLIFIDSADGHVKKSSFEALTYGAQLAKQLGTSAEAVLLGTVSDDVAALGKYGVSKIHHAVNDAFNHMDAQLYAKAIAEAAAASNATAIVISNNVTGKAVAPRLSARMKAGLVSGAVGLPYTSNGFVVKKCWHWMILQRDHPRPALALAWTIFNYKYLKFLRTYQQYIHYQFYQGSNYSFQ